jgi:hypothetical protein
MLATIRSRTFCLIVEKLKNRIYKIIILPVVLYVCETWSDIKEEHRLRMFENSVLRSMFGPRRDR